MFFLISSVFVWLILSGTIVLAVLSSVKLRNTYLVVDNTEAAEVLVLQDMRGRLAELARMRKWCYQNVGQAAESADKVDNQNVFFIGKTKSAVQFVFYNQNDFDLFNQHWDILTKESINQ